MQSPIQEVAARNVAFMHFCYGVYASPHPATFVRKTPLISLPEQPLTPPPSPGGPRHHHRNDSIDIIIRSEFHAGSTGVVHTGTMEVGSSDAPTMVAVKLAFSEEDKERLEHEHNIYSRLHSQNVQGIPQDLGLFVDEELVDGSEGPYALIMTFAGSSLSPETDIPRSVKSAASSVSHKCNSDPNDHFRMSLTATFRAIHKAGVVHQDLCLRNLCSKENGDAFVIDFSHARSTTNRKLHDAEMEKLHLLLGIDRRKRPAMLAKSEAAKADLRRSLRLQEKKKAR